MDPKETVNLMMMCIRNRDTQSASECLDNLIEWKKKGGFSPHECVSFTNDDLLWFVTEPEFLKKLTEIITSTVSAIAWEE